jgi:hypothetical protein
MTIEAGDHVVWAELEDGDDLSGAGTVYRTFTSSVDRREYAVVWPDGKPRTTAHELCFRVTDLIIDSAAALDFTDCESTVREGVLAEVVDRYDPALLGGLAVPVMSPHPQGGYVRYSDYLEQMELREQAFQDTLNELRAQIEVERAGRAEQQNG